jgi:Zn-dependent protease with chaperone function
MRKAIVTFVLVILAAPLFGLLASGAVGARLATGPFSQQAIDSVCDSRGQALVSGAGEFCDLLGANSLLWKASLGLLALTLLLPSLYAASAYAIGRSQQWLARCFPWLVRPTMAGLSVLLMLQGLLVAYAGWVIGGAFSAFGSAILAALIVCTLLGLGFAGVALLVIVEAFRPWGVEPMPVIGAVVTPEQLPKLTERVARLAEQMNAKPPERIVVGLEPIPFVTSVPLKLRGTGILPPAETLYLPMWLLRALDEQQLDALIGHELAHFRAGDLAFTLRFAPSFRGLAHATESVALEVNERDRTPVWSLARLPAMFLIQGMAVVLRLAVNRIRRTREFEADRVAVTVSSGDATASALVKVLVLSLMWKRFREGNAKYLSLGRAHLNLSARYLHALAGVLSKLDRVGFRDELLKLRLAHPTDTHPILAERIQALGLTPAAVFDRSIEELLQRREPIEGLQALERAVTAIENDWMSIPGRPLVWDTSEEPASISPPASTGPSTGPIPSVPTP